MDHSDNQTFKTGEVARRAGVNKETVRYYERRGLITKPERRRSGYRIFTREHINQIKFIKRAQNLGFTLSEIKQLLKLQVSDSSSCGMVKQKAERKLEDVQSKIEDLKRIREVLNNLIDLCNEEEKTDHCVILNALEGANETGRELR